MTESQLRVQAPKMTLIEMKDFRDVLEDNWNEGLRVKMRILSLACINKFNITLSNL